MNNTAWLLWQLIRFVPARWTALVLAWTLSFPMLIFTGIIIRDFFDTLGGQAVINADLWVLLALFLIPYFVREVLRLLAFSEESVVLYTLSALLSKNLLESILETFGIQVASSGQTVTLFRTDINEIATFLIWSPVIFSSLVFGVIALGIMGRVNFFITTTVVLPLILIIIITRKLSGIVAQYRKNNLAAIEGVTHALGEMFSVVQTIKLAAAEERFIARLKTLNNIRGHIAVKERTFTQALNTTFSNLGLFGVSIMLFSAGELMRSSAFTVGDFSLFAYYLPWVIGLPGSVGLWLTRYKQVGISFERMVELIQAPSASKIVAHNPVYMDGVVPASLQMVKTNADRLEELRISNLACYHPNSNIGVTDISFHLWRGSFTVITGRIGAGKTTLLRTLLGLLPQGSGEIYWNGCIVENPSTFLVPPRCAYVPQEPFLFSDTLKNNICMGLPEEKARLQEAIKQSVLEQDISEMPDGLDTFLGSRGVKLSGGQRQRTAAARMFYRKTELLVFDELSSALDVKTEYLLWERLVQKKETTVLTVSHHKSILLLADQIIVLKNGQLEAVGTLEEVLSNSIELQQIWQAES